MSDIVERLTDEQIAALRDGCEGEIEISSIAFDGSISANWLAMMLSDDSRIEGGRLANAEFLAVRIARVSDLIVERALAAEAEAKRLRTALATARAWFQDYADGHAAKGDTDKAKRNEDRANFCARAALSDHLAGAGKMGGA